MSDAPPPAPRVAYALIALNVIAFIVALAAGADPLWPTSQVMLDLGGSLPVRTLDDEPWRLMSSMFLHAGAIHLLVNMFGIWQARWIGQIYGWLGFTTIYLLTGLAGGVTAAIASPDAVVVGASGAIFGVFGAYGAFLVMWRSALPDDVRRKAVRSMFFFLGLNAVIGLSVPGVSLAAHGGGLVAGFALGFALLFRTPFGTTAPRRADKLLAAGLAVIAAVVLVVPAPSDVPAAIEAYRQTERRSIATIEELEALMDAETLDGAGYAAALEQDVLVPWRSLERRLAGLDNPSPRFRRVLDALVTYVALQRAAWEAEVAVARMTPERAEGAAEVAADLQAEANQAFRVYRDRLDELLR